MLRSRFAAALVFATSLSLAPSAGATLVLGEFLGNGTGDNDSVADILADFGLDVTLLVQINGEEFEGNVPDVVTVLGFSAFNFIENEDGEIAAGEWSYAGPEIGDLIALKAGPNWGVWRFTDALTGGMPNMGLFDTAQLDPSQKMAGDLTLYHINAPVPEPSVLALVGMGLLGLGVTRRRWVC